MPLPCRRLPTHISVKAFRWRTRSDHVTRNALAARNNEAYGQGNGRQSFVPYSPSLSLKTLDKGILLLAVFTIELEMNYPAYSRALPTDTPSIFSEGRGRLYKAGYLERIISSSHCQSKLTDKVRRIHSKLKLLFFKLRPITYLKRIIKEITPVSHE